MNQTISKKPWLTRNWIWLIPLIVIISGITFIIKLSGNEIKSFVAVYTESEIYEKALEIAKDNEEVKQKLGDLANIDFLAIAEGVIIYSNNNNTIDAAFRVKGTKGKGRIAFSANRIGQEWEYRKIQIRIKTLKETINILEKK